MNPQKPTDNVYVIHLLIQAGVNPKTSTFVGPMKKITDEWRVSFAKAKRWKTREGAQKWLDERATIKGEVIAMDPDAGETEVLWERPINPADYGVSKWEPSASDHRGQVVVVLPKDFDEALADALNNNCNSQGVERQRHGDSYVLKFWTPSRHVRDLKLEIAAKVIRRWREAKTIDEIMHGAAVVK